MAKGDRDAGSNGERVSEGAQMKKRKRANDEPQSEAEALRRRKQRELQALALQLRATGKGYNPHKAKARVFKDVNKGVVTPRPSQQKAAAAAPQAPPSRKPQADFQVAVVPIFWNQNPAQKKLVLAKCHVARDLLVAADITCHVDEGSHFTPGQKMRHWEEKGVKVRLEIGPKDAEQSQCVIARSQPVAGEVAHKVAGEIGAKLAKAVKALLAMKDKDVPKGDSSKYQKKDGDEKTAAEEHGGGSNAKRQQKGKLGGRVQEDDRSLRGAKDSARGKQRMDSGTGEDNSRDDEAAETDDDSAQEDGEDAGLRAQDATAMLESGDALDDDFGAVVDLEDVPEALSVADRKRLRKKAKSSLLRKNVVESVAPAPDVPLVRKKVKVVKF